MNNPEAFLACPVISLMNAGQQAHVLAVYQLAEQQTRQQLKPTARKLSGIPEFSLN